MDAPPAAGAVLVIGLDPFRVPGGWDPQPIADGIEIGRARFVDHGVDADFCLFGLDGSDDIDGVVTTALTARPRECIVIGGGVRGDAELLERLIALVQQHAPGVPIAFNSTPADTYDAYTRRCTPGR